MLKQTIFLLAIFMLILGCSKPWQEQYYEEYKTQDYYAKHTCTDYGQSYVTHYLAPSNKWLVICSQESPYKIMTKDIIGDNDET